MSRHPCAVIGRNPRSIAMKLRTLIAALCCLAPFAGYAQLSPEQIEKAVRAVDDDVIAWRRDIHQHPELSNREFRTSKLVADHLRKLGLRSEEHTSELQSREN